MRNTKDPHNHLNPKTPARPKKLPKPKPQDQTANPTSDVDFQPSDPLSVESALGAVEESHPWLQMPGEPDKYYHWFHFWLLQGSHRSMLSAFTHFAREYHEKLDKPYEYKPQHFVSNVWIHASENWNWKDRARAFDANERAIREKDFEERRRKYQGKSWDYVEKLHERVDQMFKHPLTERKLSKTTESEISTVNGQLHQTIITEFIVKPAAWRISDIPKLLEAADELERTATAIEVDEIMKDLDLIDDEQLIAMAEAGIKARRG